MRVNLKLFCKLFFASILIAGFGSCSKKDQNAALSATGIQSFNFIPGKDQTDILNAQHLIKVISSNSSSGKQLTANFTASPGASLTVNGVTQLSGITINNFEQDLNYTVTAADKQTKTVWKVQATNNDHSISWGLGHFISSSSSLSRSYNWYIDQSTSGDFSSVNCGPASVTMAIKWADSTFSKTAFDARQTFHAAGGWWFTSDIDAYLVRNNIPHAIIGLSDTPAVSRTILTRQLDHQQLIILCLDMNYIRPAADPGFRVDKFYPTTPGWGHFIVLKGYRQVDGEVFFEAYDPFSFGQVNTDLTLRGMNRYYRYEDLAAACLPWWNFAMVIAKKGEALNTDAAKRKLNPARVPVAHNF